MRELEETVRGNVVGFIFNARRQGPIRAQGLVAKTSRGLPSIAIRFSSRFAFERKSSTVWRYGYELWRKPQIGLRISGIRVNGKRMVSDLISDEACGFS